MTTKIDRWLESYVTAFSGEKYSYQRILKKFYWPSDEKSISVEAQKPHVGAVWNNPPGIVVSNADSCDVGSEFESRRRRKSSHEVNEREREMGVPDHSHGVFPQNWDGTQPNLSVTCMELKATAKGKRKLLALCHD
ncbi:hypothetical protein TNCV_1689951 [Trichonephila clavipes]|nr:hypothetical protein TNCV_1689951 [Trichonephila clavipes]